ncbi:MAG: hypothetical protein ABGZ24_08735, partial [Fuerstiella sp.]
MSFSSFSPKIHQLGRRFQRNCKIDQCLILAYFYVRLEPARGDIAGPSLHTAKFATGFELNVSL